MQYKSWFYINYGTFGYKSMRKLTPYFHLKFGTDKLLKKIQNFVTLGFFFFSGCPPKNYGPLCSKMCPVYCNGPCDLVTGNCTFGCVKGWIGDQCELGMKNVFSFTCIYTYHGIFQLLVMDTFYTFFAKRLFSMLNAYLFWTLIRN